MRDTGLANHTALITGRASGIGLGIARSLAQEGVNLAIASRNTSEDALPELSSCGVEVFAIRADVSKKDQVIDMVQQAISHFGCLDHCSFLLKTKRNCLTKLRLKPTRLTAGA